MNSIKRGVWPIDVWVSPIDNTQSPVIVTRFRILSPISEGGSARCYEAEHPNGNRGVLKEFWPADSHYLSLDGDDRVCLPSGDNRDKFEEMLQQYVSPYLAMLKKKQSSTSSAQQLASFIPTYEVYRGCESRTGRHNGTAYVWIPIPEYVTFYKICQEIRKAPMDKPQYKLVLVLKTISELAACVYALHDEEMIHRDIKPANFGFMMRNKEILEQTLSFFDLDTVCSCYEQRKVKEFESEGFSDPSSDKDLAGYLRDIYSIGATLFHALAIRCDEEGYIPHDGDNFRKLVGESPLIVACQQYARPSLKTQLADILSKCLGSQRYKDCAEIQRDVRKALSYIVPKGADEQGHWTWRNVVKHLDKKQSDKAHLALQYHLYKNPLYNYITSVPGSKAEQINILVLGFGYYGQTFTDSCLQAGQLPNVELNLTVVSDDSLDRKAYLGERPELCRFVNVDGSLADDPERYASIRFEQQKLLADKDQPSMQAEPDALIDTFDRVCKESNPSYIMIALGNDILNRNIAQQCFELMGAAAAIYYICEGEVQPIDESATIKPVYVFDDIRKHKEFSDLERMAFNTHLVWEKSMGINFNVARETFMQAEYAHHSSLDYVLALKCKLYAFGIDLDKIGFNEAAKLLEEKIESRKTDSVTRTVRSTLIWLEHRRWVLEKITKGWRTIEDLDDCAAMGEQKDEANKRHACIRRSQPNQHLAAYYCTGEKPIAARWDGTEPIPGKPKPLDELDQMSLDLHRAYLRTAEKQKRENWGPVCIPAFQSIETRLEGFHDALCAWKEFRVCMEDVWHGEQNRTYHYSTLRAAFLSSIASIGDENKALINIELEKLDIVFRSIRASARYTDFKREDVKLVDEIPFILTYAAPSCMIIPYVTGNSSDLFQNVAAPLTVNPTDIVYLHHCSDAESLNGFVQSFGRVVAFLKRKNIGERIALYITYSNKIERGTEIIEKTLEMLSIRLSEQTMTPVKSTQEAVNLFRNYLNKWRKREIVSAVEENDSQLSWLLCGAKLYESRAYYRFDTAGMTFISAEGCPMFKYISKKPYLSVSDIMSLSNGRTAAGTTPEFFDCYAALWEKSLDDNGFPWKNLCYALKKHSESHDVLAKFPSKTAASTAQVYRYDIIKGSLASAKKIINALKEYRLIGPESAVEPHETTTYVATIHDFTRSEAMFNKLFGDPGKLEHDDEIVIYEDRNSVVVYLNQLHVEGFDFSCLTDNRGVDQARSMLKYLVDNKYLLSYQEKNGSISFWYKSTAYKHLFTNEGRILEVYVYHKLKDSDFDGVVSGYEVYWEDRRVKNEFDCIAVKGFQSLFMEMKFTNSLSQDYYFKLASLVRQFGVNAKAVLIANTGERENEEKKVNQMHRKRGEMMGITTIWKEAEIRDIDKKLLDILHNESKSE